MTQPLIDAEQILLEYGRDAYMEYLYVEFYDKLNKHVQHMKVLERFSNLMNEGLEAPT